MTARTRPPRLRPSRPRLRRGAVASAAAVALTVTLLVPAGAGAAPPSSDGPTAAGYGARWAATKVNAPGFVPNPDSTANVSATIETALALAFAGVDRPTFDRAVGWLRANVATALLDPSGNPGAGQLGYLLMLAHVSGDDPTAFGGVDLVATLTASLGAHTPGLYGLSDPTYDGAFRQAVALLGLVSVGVTPPATAVQWLRDQQCGASPASATGGWQPYRASLAVPCDAPDPNTFVGPDTNSTALAVQALSRLGGGAAVTAGLAFLDGVQAGSGGFAFVPGGDPDPNSTALVVQAIVAGGEDPSVGRWAPGGTSALAALLSWQLGCTAAADEVGAFTSPFSDGAPDAFATRQAVWGASGRAFPPAPSSFAAAPVPCRSAGSTTSTTTVTSGPTDVVVVPGTSGGGAVVPAFTG